MQTFKAGRQKGGEHVDDNGVIGGTLLKSGEDLHQQMKSQDGAAEAFRKSKMSDGVVLVDNLNHGQKERRREVRTTTCPPSYHQTTCSSCIPFPLHAENPTTPTSTHRYSITSRWRYSGLAGEITTRATCCWQLYLRDPRLWCVLIDPRAHPHTQTHVPSPRTLTHAKHHPPYT